MVNMQNLEQLINETVENLGFEVVAVEHDVLGKNTVLRIYIDHEDGIKIENCEQVSRQLSAVFDINDPISDKYMLEVSSPGIDRPLTKKAHFEKYVGERVKVTSKVHQMGRRRFTGELVEVVENTIVVNVDGEDYVIDIDNIEKAKISPVW